MRNLKTEYKIIGLLLTLVLLSFTILTSPSSSADNPSNVNFSVNVLSACSLAITGADSNNNLSFTTTVNPGEDAVIGSANVKAICNDPNGLAVYAVGYGNNTYGETNLVSTTDNTRYIPTATASSSSQWNMTLTPITGTYAPSIATGFDSAHAIPSTYTKVAYRNTNTDVNADGYTATGASFTANFNLHASVEQTAGTYTGKVKFLLVHPSTAATPVTPVAVPHQICYYGNNEDEGSMACQTTIDIDGSTTALSANAEAQLRASNFSRVGYGFTGWNTKEDGTGTQYGPMETITFTEDMYNNGLVLFANWQAAETGVTMQTFNGSASPYSTMPNGTVIALRDIRDNDVYAVAKLADGNWWMIENLRLDYDANITTSNTQSNNGAFGGVFAGLPEPESADFSDSTTANSLYTTDTSSTNLQIITGSNQGYRFPRYNNDNTANRETNATGSGNTYSYGNYYTWSAAVADTANYTTGNQSVTNTSLCPTGWHLPKGGNKSNEVNNEWWNLTVNDVMGGAKPSNYSSDNYPYYDDYNLTSEGTNVSNALRAYPTNLVYSGNYYVSSVYGRGSSGHYWSSTVGGSTATNASAYNMSYMSSLVYPGTICGLNYIGPTVRCLAD